MPNHLASASSPYLLQHANNPVEWYPWGPEALERARREDKPILLSIGYAACHWCHVMEHESFENAAIAALMNDLFVNIKVDREERPDLDAVYMQAVQAMTGHGGWPMTMFLLPTGEPYYGGTYFPPNDRQGMPGFPRILQALATAYREDRAKVEETGRRVREIYASASRAPENGQVLTAAHLERAFRGLARQFDETFAGFGGAPKFPPTMSLDFLLRHWARHDVPEALDMVHRTFLAMARGGICDQVGGGIHRYSVDERWLVPHFEKMLYDNALFIRLGAHLWQATHDDEVRRVTMAAVQWVAREMTSTEGGFFSSLDADSEGHEGTFYLWDAGELDRTLGADAPLVKRAWGVTPGGNFEGRNIPHLPAAPAAIAARHDVTPGALSEALDRASAALYPVRAARVWPATDDKVLAGWNGLMIRALCAVVEAFRDPSARALALNAGSFLRRHLVRDHRVLRSWRQGRVLQVGFLEDAAATGLAFLDLFSMTGEASWLHDARAITTCMIDEFRDPESGLFFDTPRGHEELLTRPRDITDNAIPSGSSLAVELLARLAVHDSEAPGAGGDTPAAASGLPGLEQLARSVVDGLAESIARHPLAFGHMAGVADQLAYGAVEVAIPGVGTDIEQVLSGVYMPSLVLARDHGAGALTRGKAPGRAYVCRRYLCDTPTENPSEFAEQLRSARRAT